MVEGSIPSGLTIFRSVKLQIRFWGQAFSPFLTPTLTPTDSAKSVRWQFAAGFARLGLQSEVVMRTVVLLAVTVLVVATPMVARGVALHPGAKALFYDPATGQASLSPASPSPVTGLTPVQTLGTAFVGVHYWFENDRGVKFADPASAGLGARVRMHLRGNAPAFLTVWMRDSTHKSLELTTRSDAGPEGRWTGYRLDRDLDYVVTGDFEVAPVERATRIIFLLARAQMEQVDSFSACQEKLQRIASRTASDGGSVLVREVDRATPGQVGTYVVHRGGGQAGEEFAIASTHGAGR